MIYQNPIIKGFYPDPSVCKVGATYYMVCSSMQYFPGVPLFKSTDLINWEQIGHCLTRKSQIALHKVNSSGGVFAPSIRYNNGRFYMTTTNDTTHQNFYVWTDNINGEWSEPIGVDQGGIDPSLYFENDKTYFMSNGSDDYGVSGIVQCEIDIDTGKKLTPSRTIWQGTGGRYLEGPHLYKIGNQYYLLAAEGGTEFGHMVTYAKGNSLYGPFESYPGNPVLTNRNLGGYEIQGVGHGDLIEDDKGNWWLIHLAFRQIGRWATYHHLGREVFLTPVIFGEDGWFIAGDHGTTTKKFETNCIAEDVVQEEKRLYTFENTEWDKDWCFLRLPCNENYQLEEDRIKLRGTTISLDDADSPAFIGLRQKDFNGIIACDVSITSDDAGITGGKAGITYGEAGITMYMDENHHYDLAIREKLDNKGTYEVIERLNIGNIKSIENHFDLATTSNVTLVIYSANESYTFGLRFNGEERILGTGYTRYLSSEVAGGFTGVMIGLYAYDANYSSVAEFTNFVCQYNENPL